MKITLGNDHGDNTTRWKSWGQKGNPKILKRPFQDIEHQRIDCPSILMKGDAKRNSRQEPVAYVLSYTHKTFRWAFWDISKLASLAR